MAFKMKVMEEVSDIIQVCQEMPRLFEYFIWTIDIMYADGFLGYESERDHDYANNLDEDNDQSMQLSASQVMIPIQYIYIHTYYIHTYIHTYIQHIQHNLSKHSTLFELVPYWSSTHLSIHTYILTY
jgi:hypothetical protein